MKIKPESEISNHITPTSVISGLFQLDVFTEVVYTRVGNSWVKLAKLSRAPHTPS